MNPYIDLHCHSTASDGSLSPREVVRLGHSAGLSAMSLTDHDTVAGLPEAADEAAKLGIDFVTGIEISAEYPAPGTLHILGYGIDPQSPVLREMTQKLVEGRDNRNPRIIARLQELGVAITMEEVEAESGGGVIGRPHIAAILVRKGYVSSVKQAFDKYLAPGGLAYFDKERLTPAQAIQCIRDSGGVAVLAHPVQLRTENDAQLETFVKNLVDLGLAGLEILHSDHSAALVEKYRQLARRFGLIPTGGSDFHGRTKEKIQLGYVNGGRVPRELFEGLKEKLSG
jgi:predicted metal-dependent phosphoesterase TrpH